MGERERSLAVHFGWVSLLQDLGSKMVVPMVPLFLTIALGASPLVVGVVDGVAAATVAVVAPLVGRVTTPARAGRLVRLGYAASSLAKLALAAVSAWGAVLAVRVVDRAGKGVRDTPRDLLLASGPADRRATAFGVQQAMDKLGGAVGPLVGLLVYRAFDDSFDAVFVVAFVPCLLSVVLLLRRFPEAATMPSHDSAGAEPTSRQRRRTVVLGTGAVATVPVSLLIVRALEQGAGVAAVLGAYAVLRTITAMLAIPSGRLADRFGAGTMVGVAHVVLATAFLLAAAGGSGVTWFVLGLVGAADAALRGPAKVWLIDAGPPGSRGRVLGTWSGVSAAAGLVAGIGTGVLWGDDGTLPLVICGVLVAVVAVLVAADRSYPAPSPPVFGEGTASRSGPHGSSGRPGSG